MKPCSCCLMICVAVCMIIGLATFFSGCDPTLQPACGRFNIVQDAVVVAHVVTHERCANDCHSLQCVGRLYVDCYDSYAVLAHERMGRNVTCNLAVDKSNLVRANAEADADESYPLGSTHTLLENKNSLHCSTLKEGRDLAIVGVTFLVAAAASAAGWVFYEFRTLDSKAVVRRLTGGLPTVASVPTAQVPRGGAVLVSVAVEVGGKGNSGAVPKAV